MSFPVTGIKHPYYVAVLYRCRTLTTWCCQMIMASCMELTTHSSAWSLWG